jgi:signal transduction histidine kinase
VSATALAGCAAATVCVLLVLDSNEGRAPVVHAALVGWITLAYILSGIVAWLRVPDNRFGPLMVAAGFAPLLSTLSVAGTDVPSTLGEALRLLPLVVFLHLFLAYPSGRLERWFERIVVAAAYVTAIGVELIWILLGGASPDNLLRIMDQPVAADAVRRVQIVALSALMLTGIGVLVARRRGAGRPLRRSLELLLDCFVLALVLMAFAILVVHFHESATEPVRAAMFGVLGLAPLVFLIGLLQARLARSAVGDLVVELRADPPPRELRNALARALRDPSLTLAYWLPAFRTYADHDGRPVEISSQDGGRVTLIDRDGTPVAAMLHDSALEDEPALLDAVSAAAAIALENARLNVELRARLDELRGSRARVIDAGQKERQRLERDLHDGAQQRLVALSLELGLLEEELESYPGAAAKLDSARRQIAISLEELRELASGIYPAVVTVHGLAVALEELAAHASIPVRLNVQIDGRLPEQLEVAAYYLVSESLANIGKHAQASSATIDVAKTNGDLVVEVLDDGIGGADTEFGSGLRGLADRVEALGGRLLVWSPRGGGTRVRGEIPCAS